MPNLYPSNDPEFAIVHAFMKAKDYDGIVKRYAFSDDMAVVFSKLCKNFSLLAHLTRRATDAQHPELLQLCLRMVKKHPLYFPQIYFDSYDTDPMTHQELDQIQLDGSSIWAHLFNDQGPIGPRFKPCCDIIISRFTGSSNRSDFGRISLFNLPVSSKDLKGYRAIHLSILHSQHQLFKDLLFAGASANGYDADQIHAHDIQRAFNQAPRVSPLALALQKCEPAMALSLIRQGGTLSQSALAIISSPLKDSLKPRVFESFKLMDATTSESQNVVASATMIRSSLRIALCLEGKHIVSSDLARRPRPFLSHFEESLHAYCIEEALSVNLLMKKQPSWFSALTHSFGRYLKRSSPHIILEDAGNSRSGKTDLPQDHLAARSVKADVFHYQHAQKALAQGDPYAFSDHLLKLCDTDQQELLFKSLCYAKCAYWLMPLPESDDVDYFAKHPPAWACFKKALEAVSSELIHRPARSLEGLNILQVSAGMGFEDVCAELLRYPVDSSAGSLFETPSALSMALRFGHMDLAQKIFDHSHLTLEGLSAHAFGYPSRQWAIHEAFDQRQVDWIAQLLAHDPLHVRLLSEKNQTITQRCQIWLREMGDQNDSRFKWEGLLRACEAAELHLHVPELPSVSSPSESHLEVGHDVNFPSQEILSQNRPSTRHRKTL